MPGPTYGKSAKTVQRMKRQKPRGSFRPDPAPPQMLVRRASRGRNRFERDLDYLSTLPQFDDPDRAQRRAEKFIEKLIERYGDKVSVSEVKANSSEPADYGAAGLYFPYDDGEIILGDSPTFAWNMGAIDERGIRLTPEQKQRLSPEGRRFVKNEVNSRESRRKGERSRRIAEKILAHEYAHAEQGETNALANPDWFVEGAAELRARKLWNDLNPGIPDPHKMYPNRVKRVKGYRARYGKNASPYKRSEKILGVPLDSDMAFRYLYDTKLAPNLPRVIGRPLYRGLNTIFSVFD